MFNEIIKNAPHNILRKLEQLKFLRERPDFHPEPSCFEHIKIVTERVAKTGNPDLILAGVLHDICKFDTVRMNEKNGWPTSPGHDEAAFQLIQENTDIQEWITSQNGNVKNVALICKEHMRFHQIPNMREEKRKNTIIRWKEQGIWELLQIFGAADNMLQEFNLSEIKKNLNNE